MPRWLHMALLAGCLSLAATVDASAQLITGRVVDGMNGQPVSLAGVFLLDRDRESLLVAMADSVGRYFLTVPDSGEYILVAQRFGYLDTESPLLAISDDRDYALDLELRPEPVGIGDISVTVRNEEIIDWLRLEYGTNPAAAFGFRILQGQRLQEAKLKAEYDPTNTLRWLYVPVSHGSCVSINSVPRAVRGGWRGPRSGVFGELGAPPQGLSGTPRVRAGDEGDQGRSCGSLWLNDRRIPNELIDTIDMTQVAAVVTTYGSVRMFTFDFTRGFRRPGGR